MSKKQKMVDLAQFCYEQSQGDHDVFFEYSPYLNSVKIEAYAGGWEMSGAPDYSRWISLDPYYDFLDADKIKQNIMSYLEIC